LCAWGEARALQAIPKAPPDARVIARQFILSTNESARALLAGRGFCVTRHNFRMMIELDAPPAAPVLPAGVTIRSLVRGRDEEPFVRAQAEGFRDHWGHVETPFEADLAEWRAFMDGTPHFDPSLFLLAVDGDRVAGTCCAISQPGESPDLGWIFGLTVLRPWRRQGIAQALLLQSFAELYRRGMWRVGLGVDADSLTGATGLYTKVGMHVDRRYEFWEKELRAGQDLATRELEAANE
jgi:mycothiol synthase